jgi:hypothetical protein
LLCFFKQLNSYFSDNFRESLHVLVGGDLDVLKEMILS